MRLLTLAPSLLLVGCAASQSADRPVSIANPAATYCVEKGGTVEIRSTANGQTGYCHLPDGRVIDEWEFFRSRPQ